MVRVESELFGELVLKTVERWWWDHLARGICCQRNTGALYFWQLASCWHTGWYSGRFVLYYVGTCLVSIQERKDIQPN